MQRVHRVATNYEVSAGLKPVLEVTAGEEFELRTSGAYGTRRVTERSLSDPQFFRNTVPLTGPVRVLGVRAGEWLAVQVRAMEVASDGYLVLRRKVGLLGRYWRSRPKLYKFSVRDGCIRSAALHATPVSPMLGVASVAPREGSRDSRLVGDHGGNLDCVEFGVGSTLILPVHVNGAYLFVGDAHALMGHGELGGTGIEVASTVRLSAKGVSGLPHAASTLFPLLWTADGWLAAIGRGRTTDGAIQSGLRILLAWLRRIFGCEDSYAMVALRGEVRVCQLVNNLRTVAVGVRCDARLAARVTEWLSR